MPERASAWQEAQQWSGLTGLFKRLKLRRARKRLSSPSRLFLTHGLNIKRSENREALEDWEPTLQPYERLADIYDAYASLIHPDYESFLQSLAMVYQYPLHAILDLACGAGTLTCRLARLAERVVGLDVNEPMLAKAHTLNWDEDRVCFVRADFRRFSLGETFQAAVCASDSLNYLGRAEELTDVFRSVAAHLDPGGFFVCDALGHAAMLESARLSTHIRVGRTDCVLLLFYDPASRISDARVVFDSGVERHRRIPLEPEDVQAACAGSGLVLSDHFTTNTYRVSKLPWWRDFYVLRKAD